MGVDVDSDDIDVYDDSNGGEDSFIFNGTQFDDLIEVSDLASNDVRIQNTINGNRFSNLTVIDATSLRVRGLDGAVGFGRQDVFPF